MSYCRVIPRDLFNEANLLKCYGKICINLEYLNLQDVALEHEGDAFDVQQDPGSGDLYLGNVTLLVRGEPCQLTRPLNSMAPWPLQLITSSEAEICVFAEDGEFSAEMLDFIGFRHRLAA